MRKKWYRKQAASAVGKARENQTTILCVLVGLFSSIINTQKLVTTGGGNHVT
jgi:hypothetical protein